MHITTLRAVGGSTMVAIPKAILEGLDLAVDTKVGMRIERGRLVIEPRPRQRYTLDELLAQCDLTVPPTGEDLAWDASPPVGREEI